MSFYKIVCAALTHAAFFHAFNAFNRNSLGYPRGMCMHRESITPTVRSLLNGTWHDGTAGSELLRDKFSGEVVSEIGLAARAQVAEAARSAAAAAAAGAPGPHERGAILNRASSLLLARRSQFVATMQTEAGFTESDAESEVNRCSQTLLLCAEEARRLCGEMVPMEGAPGQSGRLGFTLRVPLGVVCAITPFNSPLNTVAHKIAPAFAAGNAVVLKPSLYTPQTANLLAEVLLEAGLPPGLLAVVHGGAEVGKWLLDERDIQFFAFTGSTDVGRQIQRSIGLRRSQMELGSIAHTIVDAGSDIAASYRKAGQVCTSVQNLLVHRRELEPVVALLRDQVSSLKFGDPRMRGCTVGPLINEAAAIRVDAWIEEAVSQGARRLVGGGRIKSVVTPTLLTETSPQMKVRKEEVFGPVLSVVPFERFEDALTIVNDSPYGLSTGVFTGMVQHALLAARSLKVGAVHINEASSSRADLMPFGGSKDSGFGREGPRYAIREMSEERLVTFT
ncbi:MAG: aldehyde dehydrogenase family protein [Chthoniobacteraceae bacterium]